MYLCNIFYPCNDHFLCLFVFVQNFQPVLSWSAENALKLNVQIKPVEPTLEAGAQIQQMLTAECIDDFTGNLTRPNHFIIIIGEHCFHFTMQCISI